MHSLRADSLALTDALVDADTSLTEALVDADSLALTEAFVGPIRSLLMRSLKLIHSRADALVEARFAGTYRCTR